MPKRKAESQEAKHSNSLICNFGKFDLYKSNAKEIFILKCKNEIDTALLKEAFLQYDKRNIKFCETQNNFLILSFNLKKVKPAVSALLAKADSFSELDSLTRVEKAVLQPFLLKLNVNLIDKVKTKVPAQIPAQMLQPVPAQMPQPAPVLNKIAPQEFKKPVENPSFIPSPIITQKKVQFTQHYIFTLCKEEIKILENLIKLISLISHSHYTAANDLINSATVMIKKLYENYKILINIDPKSLELLISTDETKLKNEFNNKAKWHMYMELTKKNDYLSDKGTETLLTRINQIIHQELVPYIDENSYRLPESLMTKIKMQTLGELILQLFIVVCKKANDIKAAILPPVQKKEKSIMYGTQKMFEATNKTLRYFPSDSTTLTPIVYDNTTLTSLILPQLQTQNVILAHIHYLNNDMEKRTELEKTLIESIQTAYQGQVVLLPIETRRSDKNFYGAGIVIRRKENTVEIKYIDPHGSCYATNACISTNKATLFHHTQFEEDIVIKDLSSFITRKLTLPLSLSFHAKEFFNLLEASLRNATDIPLTLIYTGMIQQKFTHVHTGAYLVANVVAEANNVPREKWQDSELYLQHLQLLDNLKLNNIPITLCN